MTFEPVKDNLSPKAKYNKEFNRGMQKAPFKGAF